MYFKTTASAAPRTASRIIPATSTPSPTSQSKSGSHTGAIAGGVVGGVVGFAAIVALVFFCLRRRKNRQAEPNPAELAHDPETDPHNPTMAQKSGANYSVHGSSMHSPMVEAPAYSPQGSTAAPNPWNGEQHPANLYQGTSPHQPNNDEWPQHGIYARPQPYYPPPSDPSQFKQQSPQDVSVELPSTGTPAIAELPHLRSPIPKRAGQ